MKKWMSVVLAGGMVLLLSTASWAAVDVGGYLQGWYESKDIDNVTSTGFEFTRLDLQFNSVLTENSGIKTEVRFNYAADMNATAKTVPTTSGGTTTVNSSKNSDIRVNQGYYYHNDVFAEGDEVDVGFFGIDFASGDYQGAVEGSLNDGCLGPDNHLGVKYMRTVGKFDGSFAVTNGTDSKAT